MEPTVYLLCTALKHRLELQLVECRDDFPPKRPRADDRTAHFDLQRLAGLIARRVIVLAGPPLPVSLGPHALAANLNGFLIGHNAIFDVIRQYQSVIVFRLTLNSSRCSRCFPNYTAYHI